MPKVMWTLKRGSFRRPALGLVAALLLGPGLARQAQALVTITEIMYHPEGDDRSLEFIELCNESPDPIDISDYYFSAGVDFTIPRRTILDPGAYVVVCANAEALQAKHGITNVVGNWSSETSLDDSGETVALANPAGVVEARIRYNDRGKWPSGADGTGHSLELIYLYSEMDDPDHWDLSGVKGGSPGKANQTRTGQEPLHINEASLSAPVAERFVEIYNSGNAAVNLLGYHMTNDRADLVKATLPSLEVPPRGWVTLSQTALGLDLTADAASGRIFLALVNAAGNRVIDARIFEPAPGVSEARIPDGDRTFSTAADPTPGAANKVTVVRDVVINELLYHPYDKDSRSEFIELYNRGGQAVSLTGWKLRDGVRFDFPAGTSIGPDAYLVIARDPEHIRETYDLSPQQVLGPVTEEARDNFGMLADSGERVSLEDERGNVADTMRYYDGGEWPRWADGGGASMELIDPFQDNSTAQAWDSSDDSAEAPVVEYSYTGQYTAGEGEFHLVLTSAGITEVDDLKMVTEEVGVDAKTAYVDHGDTWKYFKGTQEPSDPIEGWRQLGFDDSAWLEGPTIIGFGEGDESTVLDDMRGNYVSLYLRKTFELPDPSTVGNLILEVEYDDGFYAYLNGQEVAGDNMRPDPAGRLFDSGARSSKEKAQIRFDLSDRKDLLVAGTNVLGFQVHNSIISNSDVRFTARLVSGDFIVTEGPNLLKDGNFDTEDYKTSWTIQGTHVYSGRTTHNPLSGAGSFKIISTGGGDNKVNRIETSNSGMTAPQRLVDYRISFLARWICGTPTLLTHGAYLDTNAPSYATSHRLTLPKTLGTPGAINSVTQRQIALFGDRDMGPVIEKVRQEPPLPAANEPVTVTARVLDPDGVASVRLHFALDTPKEVGSPGVTSIEMTDPDKDGYYTGEIPGQLLKKRVVYHITAVDTRGRAGRFPLDYLSRTNPPRVDPAATSVNDPLYCVYRADTPFNGKPQSYRFWMHQANEAYLGSRPLHSNDVVDGTFLFQNTDLYYNSKIRFSGSPWARQAWSESYRIRIPKDHLLHGAIQAFGMEDHQDGGARSAKERISHYLLRYSQGNTTVPYSLQWLTQLQVNDRINETREHVQVPNTDFLSRWFPDDDKGAFFEMDDRHTINDAGTRQNSNDGRLLYPPYGPTTLGDDKEQYRYYFSTRGGAKELDDFSELVRLAKLLTASVTPAPAFGEQVWDIMNVESFLRVWSIRMNTDDWDTWGTNRGKNCYLYRGDIEGRWYLFPWDMELTYGNVGAFLPPTLTATSNPTYGNTFAEVTRFINYPPIKRRYYGILKELIDNPFNSAFLTPYMLKLDSIQMVNTQIGKAGGFIDQRRTQLATAVRAVSSPAAKFTITTNGGQPLEIESPQVALEGKAPVEIAQIVVYVNGREADPPFAVLLGEPGILDWRSEGMLPTGKNTLQLVGMNSLDEVVEEVSMDVTVLTAAPPVIDEVSPSEVVVGEVISVKGQNFRAAMVALFGDIEASELSLDAQNPGLLYIKVPDGVLPGDTTLRLRAPSGLESAPYALKVLESKSNFIRGDIDLSRTLNLTDALVLLRFLFQGGAKPTCLDAGDADDNGALNLTDAIYVLRFLFQGGSAPPAPYPDPGADATPTDDVDCTIGVE